MEISVIAKPGRPTSRQSFSALITTSRMQQTSAELYIWF